MNEITKLMLWESIETLNHYVSLFAPHEVSQSSRQRCIIDVKNSYFS